MHTCSQIPFSPDSCLFRDHLHQSVGFPLRQVRLSPCNQALLQSLSALGTCPTIEEVDTGLTTVWS